MKNLVFFRISFTFILFLWLFGHDGYAQQLICPSPIAENIEGGKPFSLDWSKNLSTGTKYIPTVVHLLGTATSLNYAQIAPAIAQLNNDFTDPSGDHTVIFVLATIGPNGQCTDGITRHPSITYSDPYQSLTRWPNDKYYNIWVTSDPSVLGVVSVLPSKFQVINGELIREDRIAGQNGMLDFEDGLTINKAEIYPNQTGGHTLTHETGHWLNLLHVFTPCELSPTWDPLIWDCCEIGASHGDFIEDTPHQNVFATANPADCNQIFSSCGNSAASQENFMSYGGPCINSFTNGQRDWMTHCLDNFRPDIWSESNLRCTGVMSENNPVIATGQNLTWNTSKTVTGTLIIESGATLTIPGGVIIQFCDQGKVIIKQGGRLNLYGTLTSSCAGRMWQGVEVWGTKSKNQINQISFQGQLWGYSGAVIEHAKTGVVLDNPAALPTPPAAQITDFTGGVLICEGVSFLNNALAVQFNPYENNFSTGVITSNRARFTTCLFETNNSYRGDNLDFYDPEELILFHAFVELKGVRGLVFQGCQFQNMRDNKENAIDEFYGTGIISTDADFSVTYYCNGPTSPTFPPPPCAPNYTVSSSFKNLFVGINAGNTDLNGIKPYSYQINKTLFEGNWSGIQSAAGSRAIITRNTFFLGKVPPFGQAVNKIVGLVLFDTHSSFTVQENSFSRDPSILPEVAEAWDLTGIEASSIGEYDNLIRKNYFRNLKIGNLSVGDNADPLGDIGLLYLCNENTSNDNFDFNIKFNSRIKAVQADQGIQTGGPAGNLFSLTGPMGSDSDFKNTFDIDYVHGTTFLEVPQFFDDDHFFKSPSNQPRSCASTICDDPPCTKSKSEIDIIRQQIDNDVISRDSVKVLLLMGSPNQPITTERERLRNFLTYRIHTNAAEVATYLAYTDGDNSGFREVMAQTNSYDADLALANDYLGSNETGSYHSILNGLSAKYQLTGDALSEFNAYRTVTDMMAQHYTNGGNKYNLGSLQVNWLKDQADNSPYFRSRGMARRILRLYGYYYPVDYESNTAERSLQYNTRPSSPELFSIFPNPANQLVQVHIETGSIESTPVRIRLIHPNGTLQEEKKAQLSGSGDFSFATQSLASGVYLIQVWLESGSVQTKRVTIIH